ncbi:NAD+ synthase [Desulforhopalus singaporensis]|uniref:Glutamine-dependent NAD(+) synthetase n=1 Tax=Desulforhopalus singaporensis TaxID=91360 RepID=A0A1H0NXH8_9BACT|nr:NAD+ synthase [Desulforhopalus singaporensis]SDO97487.1 NH(3)-dependent NAD(+) synthetase [Desulforhopalus singaporensis]
MKIGLVQINPVIGDFAYNCRKVLEWSRKAVDKGCTLVVFPELVVSGYPPQDLLERESFIEDHDRAVAQLVAQLPAVDVMFGCFEKRTESKGKRLYNSAVVARGGAIVLRVRKQLLPTYDVFDESRYFEPGFGTELYRVQGLTFGVTVCEDVWGDEVDDYGIEPVETIVKACRQQSLGLDAIINISASPFQREKENTRKKIFSALCQKHNVSFLYANQVGGQDSLIFDGRSLAMNWAGEVVAQAEGFVEDLVVVDTDSWRGDMNGPDQLSEQSAIYRALVTGVADYCRKCGFSSAVLGLSGGIDSALTAAVAVDALGAENVLGVALPSPYSSDHSLEDARRLAANLGCRFEVIAIDRLFSAFTTELHDLFAGTKEDLTEQNLQARIRGNLLMSLSNKFGHLLLTTGNKSEMAVGYCTLYGDMSGGLAVISDVPKQMVYALSKYVNRDREIIPDRIITKPPSAELKPDQTDQDDLPPYELLDKILELHLENGQSVDQIIARGYAPEVVQDIVRRIRINEYKRKQAPMGLKVTSKAFGSGRRFPNVQNYQG